MPDDPVSYEEAEQSTEWKEWKAAMKEEYDSLIENETWDLTDLPEHRQTIDKKWVYKIKLDNEGRVDRYKARLVAKGFTQRPGIDYFETFSPVVTFPSIRTVLSMAAVEDLDIVQFDVKTAFLHGEISEEIYMKQPIGFEDARWPKKVCRLRKAIYGLKQASCVWNKRFNEWLIANGLFSTGADPCVYFSRDTPRLILTIFVDDGIICSHPSRRVEAMLESMGQAFNITKGLLEVYVGLHIRRDQENRRLMLDQENYIRRVLVKYGFNEAKALTVLADPNARLDYSSGVDGKSASTYPYKEIIGSLFFAALGSRPDITYAVSFASKISERPQAVHCAAVSRIMRYLRGTHDLGIIFGMTNRPNQLTAYCDADYAGDLDDRRSRNGVLMILNGGPVIWISRKQSCIAGSTTEAEYVAAHLASKEVVWLRRLLGDIGLAQMWPTTLHSNNQACIRLVHNPEFHRRTKHIDVAYHVI
jgi:hypothetical protein